MKATVQEVPLPRLTIEVSRAETEDELRAASMLRARSFYVYPPERQFSGKTILKRELLCGPWLVPKTHSPLAVQERLTKTASSIALSLAEPCLASSSPYHHHAAELRMRTA
jgi:hypothetical protein